MSYKCNVYYVQIKRKNYIIIDILINKFIGMKIFRYSHPFIYITASNIAQQNIFDRHIFI